MTDETAPPTPPSSSAEPTEPTESPGSRATPAPSGELVLEVRDLTVTYGAAQVLHGISLEVRQGEVVTIIGGNGAGKSTTLKTVSGMAELLKKVTGQVRFLGADVTKKPAHAIARMGMAHVPEGRRVFPDSSVAENLELGAYRRRDRSQITKDLQVVYERFPVLGQRRTQPAGLLSGGEQQMLAMGRGLMSQPRFLLLDEPSLGLAPIIVEQIFRIIRELAAEGTTILLVEQMANQALAVANHAYILETGIIVAGGDAAQLAADPKVKAAYLGA